ncbi:MAG: Unknown protein [uncultured Sulfurovum sp.]|uniref:Uncharacterized protein n=1 Tax=uncultured Sulfurovum sp. TaxID=269237 RepID=A0A6S6TE46_9BACT|nr:MAG: Unknown protein [uncultured Sulfurovum sp.]
MNTFQIVGSVLDEYKNSVLDDKRIDALVEQANEQLKEMAENEAFYNALLTKVNAPEKVDNMILWIMLMSNEDICCAYIDSFDKDFEDEIPVNDLGDLLLYLAHLKNVQNVELDGLDYLLAYDKEWTEEVDQHAVTNVLAYIQKSKQVEMNFSF